jgi:hypothetical protein
VTSLKKETCQTVRSARGGQTFPRRKMFFSPRLRGDDPGRRIIHLLLNEKRHQNPTSFLQIFLVKKLLIR